MKVHVIKIALHTVGRIGFSAALFFMVGLYLVFPAATSFLALQEDKKEDFEITATATKTVDLEELEGIKGVKKLSPVIKFNGKIAYDEYVLETEIEGIMGTYLEGENIDGTIFPDGSNMPYLILNEAALKAFKDTDGKTAAVYTCATGELTISKSSIIASTAFTADLMNISTLGQGDAVMAATEGAVINIKNSTIDSRSQPSHSSCATRRRSPVQAARI